MNYIVCIKVDIYLYKNKLFIPSTRMKTESTDNEACDSTINDDESWIFKFISIQEHKHLARIQDHFLEDRFNFYGLREKINEYENAYYAILDNGPSTDIINESNLYYLAHQRYITTKAGLEDIMGKVLNRDYGTCCRVECKDMPLIPTGMSNELKKSKTKLYCFNCRGLYEPRGSIKRLDGSAWGIGFAHLLILIYPYHFERKKTEPYVPKIYGFKVLETDDCDSS